MKKRLLIFFLIILVILLTSSIYSGYVFISNYKRVLIEKMETVGAGLQTDIYEIRSLGLILSELIKMEEECKNLIDSEPSLTYCFITDNTGKILYHNDHNKRGIRLDDEVTRKTLESKEALKQEYFNPTINKDVIDIALPILDEMEQDIDGVIRIGLLEEFISEKVMKMYILHVGALIIVIICGVLIWWFISRSVVKPMIEMSGVAQNISKGDLSQRVQFTGKDEVGVLTESFNQMIVDLKEKFGLERSLEDLKELDELKTRFFANISHELRTPLTMSIAPLESMIQGEMGDFSELQRRYLNTIHDNSLRLLKLINNLLDFSKIEAGKMKLKVEALDLVEITRFFVSSVSSWADSKELSLSLKDDLKNLKLYFDKDKIEKVILNLLSNAIKFTPNGGNIRIFIQEENNKVVFNIKDTGPGIPEEKVGRIFERFSQVEGSSRKDYQGTGIGLSLAKELVELHKGRIGVKSKVGEGSTFFFELPKGRDHFPQEVLEGPLEEVVGVKGGVGESAKRRIEEKTGLIETTRLEMSDISREISTQKAEEIPEKEDKEHTVLIIEDNADLRRFLSDLMENTYNILTASDGVEGTERAFEKKPDIIISDVMMPRKDGYQVCKEIKSDKDTRHIPVILLTAKADIAMKLEGLEYGADDYLTKPFNSRELLTRVRNLLKIRNMERELAEYSKHLEQKVKEQVEEIEKVSKLKRYLSPKLAESIVSGIEDIKLTTSRKRLTILFSDIRGFTDLSESMEPEETIDILNEYLSEMTELIFKYEGTLDKFIGDGIMVFFGDPIPQEDHAGKAVRMAVEMQDRLKEMQKKWFTGGQDPLSIGIGINTGYVTVGNIGSEAHMDYTVVGNQVNLASRLEGLAKEGEILISRSTHGLVHEIVTAEERGEVEVKGFHRPVMVYNVKGLK